METLRNKIEKFIIWLVKEIKETSLNCPRDTKW